MDRVPVKSSNVQSIGYDAATRTLEVQFIDGAVYQYFDVPPSLHEEFMCASSFGKYLDKYIKKEGFRYVKL